MKSILMLTTKVLGVVLLGAVLTSTAMAQCANMGPAAQLKPQAWYPGQPAASLLNVSDYVDPIVGMWHVKFISKGNEGIPDGTVLDSGFQTWHSDGTELHNSGRNPVTQSYCTGVWAKLAPRTYKLNHFGIAWDGVNQTAPIGPSHIQENVLLDKSGVSFSGTFSITQYDQSGNVKQAVKGTLSARRITVNTPASSLF